MSKVNLQCKSLPRGWVYAQMRDLGQIVAGGTPSTSVSEYWGDDVQWVTPADLSGYTGKFISKGKKSLSISGLKNSSARIIPKGSILFSSRAPIGYVAIASNEISTNQGFKSLIPSEVAFNQYVYHYLKSAKQLAEKLASGTTFKELSSTGFGDLPISIPPIAEQHRIVDKIEELFSDLDAGLESLKTARSQLKIYRQSVLKWAFEGKLTAEWRQEQQRLGKLQSAEELLAQIKVERENRYQQQVKDWEKSIEVWEVNGKTDKKPTKPQQLKEAKLFSDIEITELPKLMEGWCYVRAESISDFITKGTTPDKNELYSNSGDIPFIKVYNLTHGGALDFSIKPTFVSSEIHNNFLSRSRVFPGDILMNIVGPPLGKTSLIPNTFDEWNINQAIARYRLLNVVSNRYFLQYLLSQGTIDRMSKKAKATVGQFNLTLEICRDVEIPICSLEEQHQIVQEIESRLSICDNLEATIEENLQRAESLRQSILKQAFTGKLVPQDPNDEPAAQLLARIQQEQSAQQPLLLKPRKPGKKTP